MAREGKKRQTEVLVVGAGPVGLFCALNLAERKVPVEVIDKDWRGSARSYALALHPASLRLLDETGLARDLVPQGPRIDRVVLYDGEQPAGTLDYRELGGPHPYLLILPQSTLEQALADALRARGVPVHWQHQAMDLTQQSDRTTLRVAEMEKYSMGYPIARTEWMIAREYALEARFVVGADGYHSLVRKKIGTRFEDYGGTETFSVFEFPGKVEARHEARIVLHDSGTGVLWPISDRRSRWSFQVDDVPLAGRETEALQALVRERAPWFRPVVDELLWCTTTLFERRLATPAGRGRVWLAGDAAHVTGPVGVHSMNVGLREAHELGERIAAEVAGDGAGLDAYGTGREREWRRLLGQEPALVATADTPEWARRHLDRLLPCIPASGDDLARLAAQLGLEAKGGHSDSAANN